MKKFAIIAATAAAMASTPAAAQLADNQANGSATAEVVAPITLTHTDGAELSFGTFTAGTGGTVVVTQAGTASTTGDVVLLAGSVESADSFDVSGDADRSYTITASGDDITHTDGTTTMSFTVDAPTGGTLDGTGNENFAVGGTLTVASDQLAGDYAGTYLVSVAYN